MIWSKQYFYFDVAEWIKGDPSQPPPPANRRHGRNREWEHLNNADIISMPDKWEYPWYAAWDLAFHRSEEHTSELQSQSNLVCRLLLEKKKKTQRRRLRTIAHVS